ncbi:MAG: HAD hydrolase-like protein [Acidobacteriota bacterium]
MKLLLFDIDGTLLKPMGVGKRAFLKSLEKKFGKIKEPPNFTYDGLLDIEIVNKSLELMGAQATEEEKKEILKDYVSNLKYELPQNKKEWLCPNVPEILSKAEEKNFALSIVTGNIKEAAQIKLSSTGIDNYFPTGAYGDDADERWKLIGIAKIKAEEHYNTFFDIKDVFSGAKDMYARCSDADYLKNPAYLYAILHYILYRRKNKPIAIMMPFAQSLKAVAEWYVQLLAESLGKKYSRQVKMNPDGSEDWAADKNNVVNSGRTPIPACGTGDLHSVQQNNVEGQNNKVVTFIRVEKFKNELSIPGKQELLAGRKFSELIKLAQEATEWALAREERPNCTIIMPEVSGYNWGALLFFFEMATAFEGELLNVNAFDQPGVEGYKNYMYYKLDKPGIPQDTASQIKNHPLVKDPDHIL